jgi:hypothetical protein
VTGATTLRAKRTAADLLVNGGTDAPADRGEFLNGTGSWADRPTGLDDVDFWVGGLAEKQMPFGGLLGSTFNFVFETQLEKLQDGDRLYYLHRTPGLNFLTQLEENSFAELVMRTTDTTHLPFDIFSPTARCGSTARSTSSSAARTRRTASTPARATTRSGATAETTASRAAPATTPSTAARATTS